MHFRYYCILAIESRCMCAWSWKKNDAMKIQSAEIRIMDDRRRRKVEESASSNSSSSGCGANNYSTVTGSNNSRRIKQWKNVYKRKRKRLRTHDERTLVEFYTRRIYMYIFTTGSQHMLWCGALACLCAHNFHVNVSLSPSSSMVVLLAMHFKIVSRLGL